MKYLHYELELEEGDVVEVTLDKQANVRLLDRQNFLAYDLGARYTFYGTLVKELPFRIAPPQPGHWHLAIDLGGIDETVQASVRTITRKP